MSTAELNLWLKGPAFLRQDTSSWHVSKFEVKDIGDDVAVKRVATVVGNLTAHPVLSKVLLRYFTWTRSVRGTAWLKRFLHYVVAMYLGKSEGSLKIGHLKLSEIESAESKVV